MPIFERGDFDEYIPVIKTKQEQFDDEHKKTLANEQNDYSSYKTHFADIFLYSIEGEILLLKRSPNSEIGPSKWCLPGGHVDAGENAHTAATRELLEETLIDVKYSQFVGAIPNPNNTISSYFIAVVEKNEFQIVLDNKEHVSWGWFTYNEIINKDLLFDLKIRTALIFPSAIYSDLRSDLVLKEANLLTYIKKDIDWLHNSYFWTHLEKSKRYDNILKSWLDSDVICIEDYFYLNSSENQYLIKAVGGDPSRGGTLVKKYVTDNTGRKQVKWVKRNANDPKTDSGKGGDDEETQQKTHKEHLFEHAKDASDEALQQAIKLHQDEKIVDVAKHELISRNLSEHHDENVAGVAKHHPDSDVREEAKKELQSRESDSSDKELDSDYPKQKKLDEYSKDFDFTDAYSMELDTYAESFDYDVKDHFEKVTGKPFNATMLAKMCGGVDAKDTKIKSFKASMNESGTMDVEFKTDKYQLYRTFVDQNTVKNELFIVKQNFINSGIGAKLFTNQVNQLSELGFKNINADCDRRDDGKYSINGVFTWGRLGFGYSDETKFQSWASKNNVEADSFGQLMSHPEGREIWKKKGEGFNGTFDLSEKSLSKLTLQGYLATKHKELNTKEIG